MKKMKKLVLTSAGIVSLIGVGVTAVVIPTVINKKSNTQQNTTPSIQDTINNDNSTLFKVKAIDDTFNKFELEIINNDDQYGQIVFANGQTTMIASPGDKITLTAKINEPDKYTLLDIQVFDEANPNISLGVEKDGDEYSFVMPSVDEEHPFYQSGNIKVKPFYGLKQLKGWTYNFDTKHYEFNVTEDNFVFDQVENPNLELTPGTQANPIQYRIYLNGHSISIKNLTIPKGVQFMFINNQSDSYEGQRPVVSLAEGGKFVQNGVVGRYGSVEYSEDIKWIVGTPNW